LSTLILPKINGSVNKLLSNIKKNILKTDIYWDKKRVTKLIITLYNFGSQNNCPYFYFQTRKFNGESYIKPLFRF